MSALLSSTRVFTQGGAAKTMKELFHGKKVLLVGFPGAFTPVCTKQLKEYGERFGEFKAKGVDHVYGISVNDHCVMEAFSKSLGMSENTVEFVSDVKAEVIQELGMHIDLTEAGLGVRPKRFALYFDGDKVVSHHVEDSPGELSKTSAGDMLSTIQ